MRLSAFDYIYGILHAGVSWAGCGSISNENPNAHFSGVRYVAYVTGLLLRFLIHVVASDCYDD
jgi:hypothetical protein